MDNTGVPQYKQSISRLKGLQPYVSSKDLKRFVENIGIEPGSSRRGNLALIIECINSRQNIEDQEKVINGFNSFFLNQLKSKNRVVGISYFGLQKGKFAESPQEFAEEFFDGSVSGCSIFQSDPSSKIFTPVYHKIISTDDSEAIKCVQIIYSKIYFTKDDMAKDPKENHVEFVRINFDVQNNEVQFYFPYPKTNTGKEHHSTFAVYERLSKKILSDFKVQLMSPDTEQQVFNIYKKFTEDNELEYVEKLNVVDSEKGNSKALEFYNSIVTEFDSSLKSIPSESYVERIKRVFIRLYIDQYFETFVTNIKKSTGYITGFIYKDLLGSSITGKNSTGKSLDDQEIDPLQASDTYLDTRDTIFMSEKLFSVRVKMRLSDGTWMRREVRFTAYHNLITIHFISDPISEENKDYVLQQFRAIIQ